MNVIFLDIDGVLNSELYYKSNRYIKPDKEYAKTKNAFVIYKSEFDPLAIEFLNKLIEETDSNVVITSTWRNKGLENLQKLFESVGFKYKLFDMTPYGCKDCLRGNEIIQWIKNNKKLLAQDYYDFNSYVILDDDSDMLYWQRNNFILIDGYVGLTKNAVYRAKRILGLNKSIPLLC